MAEASKARFVRCPKCNNLLTELPNFSVYQCGSCAAVLQATKKSLNGREAYGDGFEKLERLPEKGGGISMNPSEIKHGNHAISPKPMFSREKDRVFKQRPSHPVNHSSMEQPSIDSYTNRRAMMMMKEKQKGFDDFAHRRVVIDGPSSPYRNTTRLMGSGDNRGECSTSNSYGYGNVRKDYDPFNGATTSSSTRTGYREPDRAELLRKVDELKQQLIHVSDYSTSWNNHNVGIPSPYPHQSHQQSPRGYYSRDFSGDQRFESRPHETLYRHHHQQQAAVHSSPACYNNNCHVCFSKVQSYGSKFSCDMSSVPPSPATSYNAAMSRDQRIQARWVAGAAKGKNGRHFRSPIAFGAPFITCCACFELLTLPRKTRMKEKDRVKLRCGACSVVLMLELRTKRLVVSVCEEMAEMDARAVDGSCDVSNEVHENGTNVLEVQQATSVQGSIQSEELILNGDVEWDKRKDYASRSTSSSSSFCSPSDSSDEEESIDDMVVPRHVSSAIDLAVKDDESPSMSALHHRQESSGGSKEVALKLQDKGNRNTHYIDQANDASREDASPVAAAVPEMEEFSFSDYRNMDSSLDSIEISNAKASPIHRFAGVLKKSFKDFTKPPTQQAKKNKPTVFVNGQPIHEDTLRMAEKLAGPIHPGDYWYDFRAGFWGVMGQPCLGVIPAFIEKFNYPMPRNCAAGNTGVFVNGRELHQQDMELLSKRGLPTLKHKFYTLEIDGRLYDDESGKELGGLGKLAPTVEKVKRGFGMKVPSFVE